MESDNEIDKKYGPVCPKCNKRHINLGTPGENLPKDRNECDEIIHK